MEQVKKQPDSLNSPQNTVVDTQTAGPEKKSAEQAEQPHKKPNKLLMSGIFAIGGWKIATFFTSKVGLIVDIVVAYKNGGMEEVRQLGNAFLRWIAFREGAREVFFEKAKYTLDAARIGTVLGLAGGVILGLTRGDRLESAWDIVKHPIDSMKKIFSDEPLATTPKPAKEETKPAEPAAKISQTRDHVHEGTVIEPEKSLVV